MGKEEKKEGRLVVIPEQLVENLIKFLGEFKHKDVEHLVTPLRMAPPVKMIAPEPTTAAKDDKEIRQAD